MQVMRRRMNVNRLFYSLFGAALLCSMTVVSVSAADYTWVGSVDNLWNTAGNWEDELGDPGVPGEGDNVLFDLAEDYAVELTTDVETATFAQQAGDITFNLGGNAYTVTGKYAMVGADIVFTNGMLTTDSLDNITAGMTLSAVSWTNVQVGSADFSIGGESAGQEGTLRVENGSTVQAGYLKTPRSSQLIVTGNSAMEIGTLAVRLSEPEIIVSDSAVLTMTGSAFLTLRAANLTLTVDDATLSTSGSVYGGGWVYTTSIMTFNLINNGVWTRPTDASGHFYIGAEGTATIDVQGGELVILGGDSFSIGRGNNSQGTLIVRGGESAARVVGSDNPGVRLGVPGSFEGAQGTIQVQTGGLLRVEHSIWQNHADSTGTIHVAGEDARVEAGNLFVGADAGGTTTGDGSLAVSEGGKIEVAASIHKDGVGGELAIGHFSTLTMDNGFIETDSMELLVDGADSAKLSVNLHTGATGAQITVDGTASVGDAEFELTLAEGFESEPGDVFTVVAADTIDGIFNGLPEGAVIDTGDYYQFRASYSGSSFTLRTMPPRGTVIIVY